MQQWGVDVLAPARWSATEVCQRTGLTYRRLDWLIRTGALAPTVEARGSGTQRRFSDLDLLAALVAGQLRDRGAHHEIVAAAVRLVQELPDPTMEGVLAVNAEDGARFLSTDAIERLDRDELIGVAASGWLVQLPSIPTLVDTARRCG